MRGQIKYAASGKREFFIDGKPVTEKAFDAAFPAKEIGCTLDAHLPACWPMLSEAMAVHPSQVEEATARNRKHGVNVTYTPSGEAILPDRNERRKLMRLEGFHDKSGGYGD